MNLTACDDCGVVLDRDKLNFPDKEDIYDEDFSVNTDLATWDGYEFILKTQCPVCGGDILEK